MSEPEEAKLVRLIFDLYLRSRSVGAVAGKLGALGYGQKRGGRSWTPGAVHTVLRNPLYIGKVRGKDGELHVGQQEPIVDLAVFEAAARSLSDRTSGRTRQSRSEEYLLGGLLHCGACGSRMGASMARGRKGRRYRYYRCQHHQQRAASCPRGLLPADEVEPSSIPAAKRTSGAGCRILRSEPSSRCGVGRGKWPRRSGTADSS